MSYLLDLINRQNAKNEAKKPKPLISTVQPKQTQTVVVAPPPKVQPTLRVDNTPTDKRTVVVAPPPKPFVGPVPKQEPPKPIPIKQPTIKVGVPANPLDLPGSPTYKPQRMDTVVSNVPSYGEQLVRNAAGLPLLPGVRDAEGNVIHAPKDNSVGKQISDFTDARAELGNMIWSGIKKIPGALAKAGGAILDYVDAEGTPKQTAIGDFQQKASDFLVHDVAQGTARNVSSVFASIYAEPGDTQIDTNSTQLGRIVYGGEPIKILSKRIETNQKAQEPFVGKALSKVTAPLTVGGSILLDTLTGGEGKTAEKTLAKLVDVEKILPVLKGLGFEDDIAEKLAGKIATTTSEEEVRAALKAGQEIQDARKADAVGKTVMSVDKAGGQIATDLTPEEQKFFLENPDKLPNPDSGIHLDATGKSVAQKATRDEFVQVAPEARQAFDNFAAGAHGAEDAARAAETASQVPIEDLINSGTKESQSVIKKLIDSLSPMKAVSKTAQDAWKELVSSTLKAKELANAELKALMHIPEEAGLKTLVDYTSGRATKYGDEIKQVFDKLYDVAKAKGLDVPYRKNYLPQVWADKAAEVKLAAAKFMRDQGVGDDVIKQYLDESQKLPEDIAKRLKLNPSFSEQRLFPDYETGIKYGLTPKYQNPAQLAAYYRQELETVVANKRFIDKLVSNGELVTTKTQGYKVVENLPGAGGKLFYAEPKLASALNGIYHDTANMSGTEAVFHSLATFSKKAQEIALSGGIPKTNVNFFSMGQLIKELTTGNVKALPAFLRSNSNKASIAWFEKNSQFLKMMAEDGIDLSNRVGSWQGMYDKITTDKSISGKFKTLLGDKWNSWFNEKTFASFMPQLQTQVYRDTYLKALGRGMESEEARKIAAGVTRKSFGLIENMGRSRYAEDVLSTFFFAPKFREGVVRTLFNTFRSATTLAPEFARNRKLLGGMIVSYGMYDALNYALNGHHMYQNESGRKFALKIPLADGQIMYVEFMPSFLSFGRSLAEGTIATASGDFKTAKQKFGGVLSMPLKLASEVWANQDYFGRPIYKDTDSGAKKTAKIAQYFGLGVSHPYIKGIVNQVENTLSDDPADKTPFLQSLSQMMEFPLKFSTKDSVSRNLYYDAVDKKTQQRAKDRARILPIYNEVQSYIKKGDMQTARNITSNMSKQDYAVYQDIKASDKRNSTTQNKSDTYDTYLQVQQLLSEGKKDEAAAITRSMSKDEYKAYQLLKKQFGSKNN